MSGDVWAYGNETVPGLYLSCLLQQHLDKNTAKIAENKL
jgi:hypothetical protein